MASWFDGRLVVAARYLILCICRLVLQCCMHRAAYLSSLQCTASDSALLLQKLSLFHPSHCSAFPSSTGTRSAIKYQELCNWHNFAPSVAPGRGAGSRQSDDDPFSISSSASNESTVRVFSCLIQVMAV